MPIRQGGRRRMYPHRSGWPPDRPEAARAEIRSSPGELGGHQGREEQPMVHLPHGGGRQPPGQPGVALDELVVTRGGKSSRWYIFPMEAAGSHPAGPELPWGAGRPPGEGRAADGTSSPWRRPAAARPARSCPGKLVATRRTESRRMCYLPHEGGRQPPGWLGAAREI